MKKAIFITSMMCLSLLSFTAKAGVISIQKDGTSSTGEQIYKIKCSNGVNWRYYWRNGEWYRAGWGVNPAGLSSYSLEELAEKKCNE